MKSFCPKNGSEAEWRAAGARLEDYSRALDLADAGQRDRMILRVLKRTAEKYAENPGHCPLTLAMEEVRAALLAEGVPADFQRDLPVRPVRAVPDLKVSTMVPQPFAKLLHNAVPLPVAWGKPVLGLVRRLAKATVSLLAGCLILPGVRP